MTGISYRGAIALVLVVAGCALAIAPQDSGAPLAPAVQPALDITATVSRVVDGDTFSLRGEARRVRVWGLDAPEWNHPGGPAATAAMRQMVSGQQLNCQIRDIDRYNRTVAQCFLPDGRDITAEMLRMGVAREYCYFSRNYYGTCRG